ncbi:MAG: HAD family hydrolase [Candidatus Aenigmarchaeota archaeon]|nr:HAD family hydrolase [Candidatus Aenigmarchaeota archaeon]
MGLGDLKLLIFDLDGVLVDSRNYWITILRDVANKFGYNVSNDDIAKNLGLKPQDVLRGICGPDAPVDNMLKEIENNLTAPNYILQLKLKGNVKEVLQHLREKYRLALITNAPYSFTEIVLKKVDILRFFDEIITASENFRTKSDIIKFLSQVLKTPVNQIAYIGDMARDIEEAREAGCKSIIIPGWSSHDDVERAKPDLIVDKLEELPKFL